MRTARKILVVMAIAVVALVGTAGHASAQVVDYTPDDPQTSVISNAVDSGDVAGATAVQSSGALPYTGSSSTLPMAQIGVVLVAVGGAAILLVRRRQATTNA
jgi:LPXTG-motif cell wall-anchored protein